MKRSTNNVFVHFLPECIFLQKLVVSINQIQAQEIDAFCKDNMFDEWIWCCVVCEFSLPHCGEPTYIEVLFHRSMYGDDILSENSFAHFNMNNIPSESESGLY